MTASTGHPAFLAHQFDDPQQQRASAALGMWLFLATEVLFFGGMFAGYTVYRFWYPAQWDAASRTLDLWLGTINTCVLLTSSLTMALAVDAGHRGSNKAIQGWIACTIVLGAVFLGIKFYEYYGKWEHHLVPGPHFNWNAHIEEEHGHAPQKPVKQESGGTGESRYQRAEELASTPSRLADTGPMQLFFSFYFVMTGFHALHMLIGFGLLITLWVQARMGMFSSEYFTPVEITGLYWHFVDIVWVFLFPLLYLIDRT
jgi:cytochrome c oxidase subunit 3